MPEPEYEFDLFADENEPKPVFASRVYTLMTARYNVRLYIEVDRSDMISVQKYSSWYGKNFSDLSHPEQMKVYGYLTEWELAEWLRIGPEDSELFATKKLTDLPWEGYDRDYS